MIVLNAKNSKETSVLAQLLLGTKGSENSVFAKLLESVQEGEALPKVLLQKIDFDSDIPLQQNTVSTETAATNTKTIETALLKDTNLLYLLQGEVMTPTTTEADATSDETFLEATQFLHPKTINLLSSDDIKSVITNAKQYLHVKIQALVNEQGIELKQFPKTLKGLSQLAQKLGINLESITLEEIKLPDIKASTSSKEPLPVFQADTKTFVRTPIVSTKIVTQKIKQAEQPTKSENNALKSVLQVKTKESPTTKESATKELKEVATKEVKEVVTKEATLNIKEAMPLKRQKSEDTPKTQAKEHKSTKTPIRAEVPIQNIGNTKTAEVVRTTAASEAGTLFQDKAQVQTTDTTASELLLGTRNEDTNEYAPIKSSQDESKPISQSTAQVQKPEALELKIKEAHQTVRQFASDLKEAVENYKPPFTRLKMTLNPAKLGEVDVTLVQRGNNVHINVSSNNTALNILAHNATELKTQLANNGVVNTTMQFSTAHGEQQQQEGRHQQFKEFYKDINHFSDEELEEITSMEITLPRYA